MESASKFAKWSLKVCSARANTIPLCLSWEPLMTHNMQITLRLLASAKLAFALMQCTYLCDRRYTTERKKKQQKITIGINWYENDVVSSTAACIFDCVQWTSVTRSNSSWQINHQLTSRTIEETHISSLSDHNSNETIDRSD